MLYNSLIPVVLATAIYAAPTTGNQRRAPAGVPQYVLDYAPLVYLYSGENYFPSDIAAQLANTQPEVNYTVVSNAPSPLTLDNLASLNADGEVYLTSKVDITTNPAWLKGVKPDSSGKTNGAVTCAVIVNDKGNGNVDAFYMYFYAYNWGGLVSIINENLGNHVGDWEHNMVRFSNGKPTYVWYSQHSNGEAFAYNILNKNGNRPLAYSANGTHANYAITGTHDHTIPNLNLPGGLLEDHTDAGTLWDPLSSAYFYSYNPSANSFTAYSNSAPTNWLSYTGRWGDEQYPDSDKRQFELFGQPRYATGPTGPEDKQLNRTNVCPDDGDDCILRTVLAP